MPAVATTDASMLPDRIDAGAVTLRWLTLRDAPAVQRHAGDARVATMTAVVPHPYPEGAAAEWIASHSALRNEAHEFVWGIVPRGADELVGVIGWHGGREGGREDVGYWVGVPHWGRGYASAALAAVLDAAFERLGLERVQATHLATNPASGRVMEKCGMTYAGDVTRSFRGVPQTLHLRAIDRDRWRARRALR